MYLVLFLIAINLFKVIIAPHFPLIGDEAYYWLWGQHLDLSYVDHPPMIAYVNFILSSLFGNSELAIRFAAIGIVLLVSIIIYLTGKELYGGKAGILSAIIFNLIPTFFGGGMFLVPQMLLFLFWSLSFFLLVKIIKTNNAKLWYVLGITAGLGLLSDYVMALFFIGALVYLAINKEQRFWLAKKEPYLAALLSALVFSPVIIWNLRHGLTPLFYWGGKMGVTPQIGDNLLNFFGLQMLLYTPPIFIMTLYLIFRKPANKFAVSYNDSAELILQNPPREEPRIHSQVLILLKIFSAVVFVPFLLISPLINIGGHWPSTAYLPAILDTYRAKRLVIATIIGFALLVNAPGFAYYLFLYPVPVELKGKEFTVNRELPQYLKAASPIKSKTYFFANDLGMIGLVSFHGKVRVHMAPGRLRQVDLWGLPEIKKGDNIIYFALNESQLYDKLSPLFRKVSIEPHRRIFNKDADLPNKTQIFICDGFRGGNIP